MSIVHYISVVAAAPVSPLLKINNLLSFCCRLFNCFCLLRPRCTLLYRGAVVTILGARKIDAFCALSGAPCNAMSVVAPK